MSTKLAVAFIDPMSYNNLAVYDYGIINGIEKNIQLTFFCNSKYNYKPIYNTKIHSIFNYSDKKLLFKIKSYIISIIRALIIIKKEKIAIIHILWFRLPFFDVFVWSLVKFLNPNIKIVHTAHNILPHKKKPADTLFYALIYKITDKIICHTDNSRKELIAKFHLPSAKVTTIPHGILEFELDDSTLSKKIASLRQKYSLNKKIIISALGSQHFYKGTDLLIDTWKENFAKDNDKILIIAGKNIGIKIDINGLPENIIYINDFLTQEEFNAILRMSHLIVLPYRKISQSGVLLTAISEQIPFSSIKCRRISRTTKTR
jgi:D-inositol-3-phosphate glycosyltransferase